MDILTMIDKEFNLMKKPKTVFGKIKLGAELVCYIIADEIIIIERNTKSLNRYYLLAYYFGLIFKPNKNHENFKIFANELTRNLIIKKVKSKLKDFMFINFNWIIKDKEVDERIEKIFLKKGWNI